MAAGLELPERVQDRFTHAVVTYLDEDERPMAVATSFRYDVERGVVGLDAFQPAPAEGSDVNVVFSHIRPQPGSGYDERRYVQLWGPLRRSGTGYEVLPERTQGWDEEDLPFFEYAERGVPRAMRYMDALSRETGRSVRPRLAPGWLFLRATRLPFLSATFVPVLIGIAVAANERRFTWWLALLTLLGASFLHLGLNVANDVFDTMSGVDQANTTPTQFSGGSRVIHYGLVSMRGMALLSAGFYTAGAGIGVFLALYLRSWALFWLGVAGVLVSVFYTAPPLRLVHRGLGEIAVGIGFGPIMVLGAYYVQAHRFAWEALYVSLPVAILISLILYVNEIPDRAGDGAAGKRTLPVRLSKERVIALYVGAVVAAFALIAAGALSGLLPVPTLIALATIPLGVNVTRGLRTSYEDPYALMPTMAANIKLHAFTGLLLFGGYLIAIVAGHLMDHPPLFLR
jgi:1,4-dihydroxy-2-naphthoate polyprenyltransferase